ncbi:MAG: hypothetical protein CW346_17330 [Bacillaceae bacterium]|nr:hypothetical protein [Bacillaceae bacterium]
MYGVRVIHAKLELVGQHVMGLDVKFAPRGKDGGPVVYTGDRDWLEPGTPYYNDENGTAWELPRYSSDIAAAWQVVEKFKERKLYMSVECVGDTGYHAVVYDEDGNHLTDAYSEEGPAHAVCVAALRAVGVEVPVDALTA